MPDAWTAEQIRQFQEYWDALLDGDLSQRRRARFVPGGLKYQPTREPPLKDDFDEWLARIVCFAFSLPPTDFTRGTNRATAETQQEAALTEGLAPLQLWLKALIDRVIAQVLGWPDLEFVWAEDAAPDPAAQAQIDIGLVGAGIKTRNEVRAGLGLDPLPQGEVATTATPVTALGQASPAGALAAPGTLTKAGFNPDEPRDARGRWTDDGSEAGAAAGANTTSPFLAIPPHSSHWVPPIAPGAGLPLGVSASAFAASAVILASDGAAVMESGGTLAAAAVAGEVLIAPVALAALGAGLAVIGTIALGTALYHVWQRQPAQNADDDGAAAPAASAMASPPGLPPTPIGPTIFTGRPATPQPLPQNPGYGEGGPPPLPTVETLPADRQGPQRLVNRPPEIPNEPEGYGTLSPGDAALLGPSVSPAVGNSKPPDPRVKKAVADAVAAGKAAAKPAAAVQAMADVAVKAAKGSGPATRGTNAHTILNLAIQQLKKQGWQVDSEVSYKGGISERYGLSGSIRVDALVGTAKAPEAVWDLKTGDSGLDDARIAKIRAQLPKGVRNHIPIEELRGKP